MNKKTIFAILLIAVVAMAIAGCSDADIASQNISKDADQFKVFRRIVFYNGITDNYILVVEGYCSLGNADPQGELSVTCRKDNGMYVKHFLGLSDNVTYFAEQLEPSAVSTTHYKVLFKPAAIVPDVDLLK